MIDGKRLEEISNRADEADPEPWDCFLGSGEHVCTAVGYDNENGGVTLICDFLMDYMLADGSAAKDHRPNMRFVKHARTDVPELVAEVRTAVSLLKKIISRMDGETSYWGDAFLEWEYNEIRDFLAKYGINLKD